MRLLPPSLRIRSPAQDDLTHGALLNVDAFGTTLRGKVLALPWRKHCSTLGPHSSSGYPPPEAAQPWPLGVATLCRSPMAAWAVGLT